MAKTVTYGPNSTAVAGVPAVTFAVAPLNYDADFLRVDESNGRSWIGTDITAPRGNPSTVKIAQRAVSNVYGNTSIATAAQLPSKRGTDTIIEVREIHHESDSEDSTYGVDWPMRLAITFTAPDANQVTAAAIERMLARAVAAIAEQGDDTLTAGLDKLLHGVTRKD